MNHKKGEGARQTNILTHAHVMRLTAALLGMKNELIQEQPRISSLAERLSRELGFMVTAANIRSQIDAGVIPSCLQGLHDKPVASDPEMEARVDVLEERLMRLESSGQEERLKSLEKRLLNLETELNQTV